MERARLTKRVVDAFGEGVERFVWDSELAGFGIRVWPSGRKSFIVQYRVHGGRGGQQRRLTLGTYPTLTVEEARVEARNILAGARFGDDAAKKRDMAREADTVADLVKLWEAEAAHLNRRTGAIRSASSVEGEKGRIKAHILPLIGSRRLLDLKRADIERLRDQIARGVTKGERKDQAARPRACARRQRHRHSHRSHDVLHSGVRGRQRVHGREPGQGGQVDRRQGHEPLSEW